MRTPNAQLFDKGGYLLMTDLPTEQQHLFRQWILNGNQTQPVVDEQGERAFDCAYIWDYERWYEYWSRGLTALVMD